MFGNSNENKATSYDVYGQGIGGTASIGSDGRTFYSALATSSASFGKIQSQPSSYGEDSPRLGSYLLTNSNSTWFEKNRIYGSTESQDTQAAPNRIDGFIGFKTITSTLSIAGKMVNGFSNIKSNFYIKSGNIASDYIFRFENSAIDSTNKNWKDTTATATLAGSVDVGIFNNNYFIILYENKLIYYMNNLNSILWILKN